MAKLLGYKHLSCSMLWIASRSFKWTGEYRSWTVFSVICSFYYRNEISIMGTQADMNHEGSLLPVDSCKSAICCINLKMESIFFHLMKSFAQINIIHSQKSGISSFKICRCHKLRRVLKHRRHALQSFSKEMFTQAPKSSKAATINSNFSFKQKSIPHKHAHVNSKVFDKQGVEPGSNMRDGIITADNGARTSSSNKNQWKMAKQWSGHSKRASRVEARCKHIANAKT